MVTLKGEKIDLHGNLIQVGDKIPNFSLVDNNLKEVKMTDFKGKVVVLNIFPSIDTPICASSVRRFNEWVGNKKDAVVVCVSVDAPFSYIRFCGVEGIKNAYTLSSFRDKGEFGTKTGLLIDSGPLKGCLTRAFLVLNKDQEVVYREVVPEINTPADYVAVEKWVEKLTK